LYYDVIYATAAAQDEKRRLLAKEEQMFQLYVMETSLQQIG